MSAFIESGAWIALFGWPAVIAAGVALLTAVVRRSRSAGILGCVLVAPMLLYLSLTPRFGWAAAIAFGLLCIFAWAVPTTARLVSGALILPAAGIVLWVAYIVRMQ